MNFNCNTYNIRHDIEFFKILYRNTEIWVSTLNNNNLRVYDTSHA